MKKVICLISAFLIILFSGCSAEEQNIDDSNKQTNASSASESVIEQNIDTVEIPSDIVNTTGIKDTTVLEETVVSEPDPSGTTKEETQNSSSTPVEPEVDEPTTMPWEDPSFTYPPNMTPIG